MTKKNLFKKKTLFSSFYVKLGVRETLHYEMLNFYTRRNRPVQCKDRPTFYRNAGNYRRSSISIILHCHRRYRCLLAQVSALMLFEHNSNTHIVSVDTRVYDILYTSSSSSSCIHACLRNLAHTTIWRIMPYAFVYPDVTLVNSVS